MIVAVYLVLFTFIDPGLSQCSSGWLRHDDSCYHFSHDKETFVDALAVCREIGGHLAELTSARENSFVENEAKLRQVDFWIGATDWVSEGEWVWIFSKDLITNNSFTDWKVGEPNNLALNENCMQIYVTSHHGGHWNDVQCSKSINYICETPANEGSSIIG